MMKTGIYHSVILISDWNPRHPELDSGSQEIPDQARNDGKYACHPDTRSESGMVTRHTELDSGSQEIPDQAWNDGKMVSVKAIMILI